MFNSEKGNCSHHFDNTALPIVNDTRNGAPKITSTPLNPGRGPLSRRSSVLLSSTKSKLLSPRRYSLSEVSPPTNKSSVGMHSPGPLLASLNFKDNVSMYEETKSSGLARRIVLYNEEAEHERQPTHQEKYHSPGLFPVVHLFKRKPSTLDESHNRVKIRLSSPDYIKSYLPQQRGKLLEGLARPRLQNRHSLSSFSQKINDTSTKSVLDALKEISRKRIHSSEECDLNEDSGKRLRTHELANGGGSSSSAGKRNRVDSPPLDSTDSPSPTQSQKKFCVYDEFAASKSSTDFAFLNKTEPAKSKRKTISTSTESLKETKHVKLINAETQTILSSPDSNKSKSGEYRTTDDDSVSRKLKNKESLLKVFDDAPLDRIRKNRLAALMGNLAGKEAAILPKPPAEVGFPNETEQLQHDKSVEDAKESETIIMVPQSSSTITRENEDLSHHKALTSILSPVKTTKELSPLRSDKHVHFSLPRTTADSTLLTQTSGSIATPIISTSISNSFISSGPVTSVELIPKSLDAPTSTHSHLFTTSKSELPVPSTSSGGLSFSLPPSLQTAKQDTFTMPTFEASTISSPQKSGGFKFNLKVPSIDKEVAASNLFTPTFPNSSVVNETTITTTTTVLGSATFTFSGKPDEPKKGNTFSFRPANTVNSSSNAISESAATFSGGIAKYPSFGAAEITQIFKDTSEPNPNGSFATATSAMVPFGSVAAVTCSAGFAHKPIPNFGTTSTAPSSMFENSGATVVSGFANMPPAATSSSSGTVTSFGSTPATSAPIFGGAAAGSKSVFGSVVTSVPVTSTAIFGATPAPTSVYGSAAVTSTSVFPSSNLSISSGFGSAAPAKPSVFGTNNSTFGSSLPTATAIFAPNAPNFGSGSSNVFGATKSQATTFGGGTTPAFGISSQSTPATTNAPSTFGSNAFGGGGGGTITAAPTTTSAPPAFGSSSVNTTFTFGSGKPTTNVFGLVTTTNSSTGGGYGNSAPKFGGVTAMNSTTSGFGNSGPSFGSATTTTNSSTSGFGNHPTAFGSATITTISPTSGFGNNAPTFGSTTTTNASTSGFGNSFETFGTPTTASSIAASGFGNSTTPSFGTSSTASSGTFGTTGAASSAFGQVENKPNFAFGASGENKTSSVFGSGVDGSAFGKQPPSQSRSGGFGNSAGAFGSTSSSGFGSQATGSFNFGPSSQTPFAFGAPGGSTEPPKPTFNFTGGAFSPPAPTFGSSSSTASFRSSNPSFGAPTFGGATSTGGVFNIGAGSNTGAGRPRTQLRAKRRT